jgi:hypothetical protein
VSLGLRPSPKRPGVVRLHAEVLCRSDQVNWRPARGVGEDRGGSKLVDAPGAQVGCLPTERGSSPLTSAGLLLKSNNTEGALCSARVLSRQFNVINSPAKHP